MSKKRAREAERNGLITELVALKEKLHDMMMEIDEENDRALKEVFVAGKSKEEILEYLLRTITEQNARGKQISVLRDEYKRLKKKHRKVFDEE